MQTLTKGKTSLISESRKKTKIQKREDLVKDLARTLNKHQNEDVPDTHSALDIIGSYIKSHMPYQDVANQGEAKPHSNYTEMTTDGNIIEIPKRNRRGRKPKNRVVHPLRELRLKRGMTLEEVAQATSLSPSYLSRLESGSRRLNVDTIEKLSRVLSCRVEDLVKISNPTHQLRIQRPGEALYALHSQAKTEPQGRHYVPETPSSKESDIPSNHIPIYETEASSGSIDFSRPYQTTSCPANLIGIPGACGYIVNTNAMTPKYNTGDRVLIHPGKPLVPGNPALIITKKNTLVLGEFVGWRHVSELDQKFQPVNDRHGNKTIRTLLNLSNINLKRLFPMPQGVKCLFPLTK